LSIGAVLEFVSRKKHAAEKQLNNEHGVSSQVAEHCEPENQCEMSS